MKKILLTSVCALAVTGAAFAQGSVNWGAISAANMTAQTNTSALSPFVTGSLNPAFGPAVGGTGASASGALFYYALLTSAYTGSQAAQPTTLAAIGAWQQTGLTATNGTVASRLTPIAGTTQATANFMPAGVTNNVMMVGWSANLGNNWTTALLNLNNWVVYSQTIAGQLAFVGTSVTGFIAPNSANPGNAVFGAAATSFGLPIQSLNTQLLELGVPVPEPGTMALAGLGGLSLLAFRRKK